VKRATPSVAQAIASGTQDIARPRQPLLRQLYRVQHPSPRLGYGNLAVSMLSLLGILGIVKRPSKSPSVANAASAGSNLDSTRVLFGCTSPEAAANNKTVDRNVAAVNFGAGNCHL
jgi:hypothetical protein